jgi:hypothetical protein
MQRVVTDFGADESFGRARFKVLEHYGVDVSAERVRVVTLERAGRLGGAGPEQHTRLRPGGADWIIAEMDGSMLPIADYCGAGEGQDRRKHRKVSWQEAKVCAAQAKGQIRVYYDATLGDVEEAGRRWSQAAARAGWGANSKVHAVGDGAVWIAQQARLCFGDASSYLLDLFHVCEYLAPVWPSDPDTLERMRLHLRSGNIKEVLTALELRQEPAHLPDEEAPARCALRYLKNRPDQLHYRKTLEDGLPVGSGLIESSHRHLLQKRLKIAGAWWKRDNAQAMIQLRVARANDQWETLWTNN